MLQTIYVLINAIYAFVTSEDYIFTITFIICKITRENTRHITQKVDTFLKHEMFFTNTYHRTILKKVIEITQVQTTTTKVHLKRVWEGL